MLGFSSPAGRAFTRDPDSAHMWQWFEDNRTLMAWMTGASIAFFVLSIVGVAIILVRLPPDYLVNEDRQRSGSRGWRIVKNVVGWLLVAAGLAMLVLPGQGVLVLLIGVMLADFPGKRRVQRWILARPKVGRTINWVRAKFKRPPMQLPERAGNAARAHA